MLQVRNVCIRKNLRSYFLVNPAIAQHVKPPNILIKAANETCYEKVSRKLQTLLERDRYTIHYLSDNKFNSTSWKDSCCLLLFSVNGRSFIDNNTNALLKSYVDDSNGYILFYTSLHNDSEHDEACFEQHFDTKNLEIKDKVCFLNDILSIEGKILQSVLQRIGIHTQDFNQVESEKEVNQTPACFISFNNMKLQDVFKFNDGKSCIEGKDITLTFKDSSDNDFTTYVPKTENELIIVNGQNTKTKFNSEVYKNRLKSKRYGQNVVYTDIINSTQTVFTGVNIFTIKTDGLVVHAQRQLKGRGRTGNQWLSPLGCMMFSMQIEIPVQSQLGQQLSLIQHLVVVAFVMSVKNRGNGYEKLNLNLKWPNDIYVNGKTKIGGVIANSSLAESTFKVVIGLGVNINNKKPTECLNRLIRHHNQKSSCNLSELELEDALAGTINMIEKLVDEFQDNGVNDFKEKYYQHWLHSSTEITLACRNNEKAMIIGIDDFGYLKVKLNRTGEIIMLQPDGNSLDMMKNMIVLKT